MRELTLYNLNLPVMYLGTNVGRYNFPHLCSSVCSSDVLPNVLLTNKLNTGFFLLQRRQAVWPDLAIFWTLGNFLKPLATINLPKSPTFLGKFCKGIKIFHFSSEITFGQFLKTFGNFLLVTLLPRYVFWQLKLIEQMWNFFSGELKR